MPITTTLELAAPDDDDGRLTVRIDLARPVDLTVPVGFDPGQPGAFHLPDARETPVRMGGFVGSVAQGGAVNCMELSLFPHGNGTHTECAGHVSRERHTIAHLDLPALLGATLVTVTPEALGDSGEAYAGRHQADDDQVITAASLQRELARLPVEAHHPALRRALVVRTHPNSPDKRHTRHGGHNAPYPTTDAIEFLLEHGIEHLVLDLPSLDREDDGGTTPNHRLWFGLTTTGDDEHLARPDATVTELAYVPDEAHDGPYLLELQLPAIATDAVPSRVRIYRATLEL